MGEWLGGLLQWVASHPHLAGFLVAAIACTESLAFVGLVVPGASMMLLAGALVGAGVIGFWSTLAWAVAGAVVGDGLSYWLGRRYREGLRGLGPLRNRPYLLARGEVFVREHGGKSVLLARFVGPVRPVVPVVAGMLGMTPGRFYAYNIFSALIWAPAHLLPGMIFGMSLLLAGAVAGRLAALAALLLVGVWFLMWVIKLVYGLLRSQARVWLPKILDWGLRHRRLRWLTADLVDPAEPAFRSLLAWFAVLVGGVWLFLGVTEDVLTYDPLTRADQSVYHLLQTLRTPIADKVMVMLTEMGDAAVMVPVVLAVLAWLLWRRAWRDAGYWMAAASFGMLLVILFKAMLRVSRPVALYAGADAYSFPSGHATMAVVIYGFLAAITARGVASRWRWLPFAGAAVLAGCIAFSRLYLGAHWLSDVIAGMALGLAWIALLSIARLRRATGSIAPRGLLAAAMLVFVISFFWHARSNFAKDSGRYAAQQAVRIMDAETWWGTGWKTLPANRLDLGGEHEQPLNLQWAGDLAVLRDRLRGAEWKIPPPLNWRSAMNWLLPNPALQSLPVLPHMHNGYFEAVLMVHAGDGSGAERQLVLRLWPTSVELRPGRIRLWIGSVGWQRIRHLPLLSIIRTDADVSGALQRFAAQMGGLTVRKVYRSDQRLEDGRGWNGATLLLRPRSPATASGPHADFRGVAVRGPSTTWLVKPMPRLSRTSFAKTADGCIDLPPGYPVSKKWEYAGGSPRTEPWGAVARWTGVSWRPPPLSVVPAACLRCVDLDPRGEDNEH